MNSEKVYTGVVCSSFSLSGQDFSFVLCSGDINICNIQLSKIVKGQTMGTVQKKECFCQGVLGL